MSKPCGASDAYLAGLFDGEGCVSVQHRSSAAPKYRGRVDTRLLVSVKMRTRVTCALFHQRFGGSLVSYIRNGAPMYDWYVCGSNAREALACFAENCVLKAEQARLALIVAGLIRQHRISKRRPRGSRSVTDDEMVLRADLAERITALKRYNDA